MNSNTKRNKLYFQIDFELNEHSNDDLFAIEAVWSNYKKNIWPSIYLLIEKKSIS